MWLVFELTGSATATGLVGMAQYLPAVIVGIFAGALVDRWNRKRVMIVADAARVVLVALIPTLYLLDRMSGLLLGLLAFAIAIFTTLFFPARESIVPQIVKREELTRASSMLQGSFGFAYFVGPLSAAALLPWAKLTGLFYADALTYLVSLIFLLRLHPKPRRDDQPASGATLHAVTEGLRYTGRHRLFRGLLLITAIDNLIVMGPVLVGTPLYVRLHLQLGAQAFAATEGAFALGMLTGSVLVHRYGSRLPRGKILLLALMFDGITFVPFAFLNTLAPTLVLWFLHSIGIPFILVPRTTLIQTEAPEAMQGRLFSMVNLAVVGLTAVSCSLTGIVAELMPIHWLYAVMGTGATLAGAAGWFIRDLREAR